MRNHPLLLCTVIVVYFHVTELLAVTAQTVGDLIATCGGLPTRLSENIQVDLAPSVRTGTVI